MAQPSMEMMDFPMDQSAPVTPQKPDQDSAIGSDSLFFADATLDLNEAHDIAETPEPQKMVISAEGAAKNLPTVEMPTLSPGTTGASPSRTWSGRSRIG